MQSAKQNNLVNEALPWNGTFFCSSSQTCRTFLRFSKDLPKVLSQVHELTIE